MKYVQLALDGQVILNGDVLYDQLAGIASHQLTQSIDPTQFAALSEMIIGFQDDWMDNASDFFCLIQDFLKTLDFEVYASFPSIFEPWYLYYQNQHMGLPGNNNETIAAYPLFTAPKLNANGDIYNCLLSQERAEAYVQRVIAFAETHKLPIPDNQNSIFKVQDGLEIYSEKIYSQIGTERVIFHTIQYLQLSLIQNNQAQYVICLRRLALKLKQWIRFELSKEVYLINCVHGKLADLLDRRETWDEFVEKYNH